MFHSPVVAFIFTLSLCWSYQQTSKELTFCLNKPSTSNTLQAFWHDATSNCELEPQRLIELYLQLLIPSKAKEDERCSRLLTHEIRKKIISLVSQQLEEAFITQQSLQESRQLNRLLEEIHDIDKRILEAVWQSTLGAVHLFVEPEKIVEMILQLRNLEIQVYGLHSLLIHSKVSLKGTKQMLPLLAYTLNTKIVNTKILPPTIADNLSYIHHQLPKELLDLYASDKATILGFLNYAHWEYLYAPRDNGPDGERRLALTWSQEKNTTDADGHFQLEFKDEGLIAIGSRFGDALKFLYSDDDKQTAYFWIGPGSKDSRQWWQVIWPHNTPSTKEYQGFALKNNETKGFLCASQPYDENRRYATLMNDEGSELRSECLWLVKKLS